MVDFSVELARQQLQAISDETRIIVLHPRYAYQRYLLGELMETSVDLAYIRFSGTQLDGDAVRTQLEGVVSSQGKQPDLSDVKTLILDECDRIDRAVMNNVITGMASGFLKNDNTRVVLVSRDVPDYIFNQADLSQMNIFTPIDDQLLLCDYVPQDDEMALLEVHAFGQGHVYVNGEEINNWDGLLPRSLFFYLVDKGMTTRNDIFEVFWPTLTVKEATNVFHVTKRKISEVLGIDLTSYWSGFYRISPKIDLKYDVIRFSQMFQESEIADPGDAEDLLRRAISLYGGHYLSSLDAEWVQSRRQALLQMYGDALTSLGNHCENSGDDESTLGLYLRSTLTNPHREDLVLKIMRLYAGRSLYDDAIACYERLVLDLKDHLGAKPAPDLQTYAKELRKRIG